MLTASLEDYIEAMYEIIEEKQGVKAVDVAKKLGVKRSSVTEALKNLSAKGLVNYGRYEVISLTEKGKETAQKIIEKHQILYNFLTDVLNIEPEEATINACRMEHVISDNVFKSLTNFVNTPPENTGNKSK